MSRYTGPKSRVSRRLGANIWGTSGENRALERRPYPPGEHGRSRRRNASEYLLQLQEKQKARFTYGLNERQFRNLYEEASKRKGVTGELMLQLLERRLDNIVYRAGWASTRPAPLFMVVTCSRRWLRGSPAASGRSSRWARPPCRCRGCCRRPRARRTARAAR